MAADLKAKLNLDTSGFDDGIKNAKSKTDEFKRTAEDTSKSTDKLSDSESKLAAKSAKVAMSHDKSKKAIKDFNSNVIGLTGNIGSLMGAMNTGSITGMVTALMGLQSSVSGITGGISGLGAALKSTLLSPVGLAVGAIGGLAAMFVGSAKASEEFEVSIRQLSALTGASGEDLEDLKQKVLDLSDATGKSAPEIADTFKLIGSQAPQLLKNSDALADVTKAAITLSKASGMDVVDSGKAVTTVMNQMGVSADNAGHIIDAMAKAAQAGSGDIDYITTALEKSGSMAASVGVSFDEITAAIEMMADKESSADVAGSQLKSTLLKLAVSKNDAFNPEKAGSFKKALDNIANSGMTTAEKIALVGESNVVTLNNLIKSRNELGNMDKELKNSAGTAEDMALKQMGLSGAVAKVANSWNNFMTRLGETKAVQDAIGMVIDLCNRITEWIQNNDWLLDALGELFQYCVTIVQHALLPIKMIIKDIGELFKFGKTCIQIFNNDGLSPLEKALAVAKGAFKAVINIIRNLFSYLKQSIPFDFMGNMLDWVSKKFESAVKYCKGLWVKFLNWLGVSSKKIDKAATYVPPEKPDKPKKDNNPPDPDPDPDPDGNGNGNGNNHNTHNTNKVKIEYEKGSLQDLQNQLSELQKKQKMKVKFLDPAEYQKQVKELEDKIKNKEIELGIKPKIEKSTLQELEDQLKKLQDNQLTTKAIDASEYKKQLKDLQDKIKHEKIKIGVDLSVENTDTKLQEAIKPKEKSSFETAISGIEAPDRSQEGQLNAIQQQMDANDQLLQKLKEIQEAYKELGIDGAEGYAQVAEKIQDVNDKQNQLADDAKVLKKAEKNTKKLSTGFQRAGDAVGQLGSAFGSLGNGFKSPELNIAATIAQGIASVVQGYGQATAEASSMGPWAWIAFSVAAMAQVAAMIGQIHSLTADTEGYATGGIVSGNTTVGDNVLARLNSGEMILNTRQQANLFRMLDTPGSPVSNEMSSNVSFKIKGSDLVGVLNNYSKKRSRI